MGNPGPEAPPARRRTGRRFFLGVLGVLVAVPLASYLIPVRSTGTLDYRLAAPEGTEFVEVSGVDIAVSSRDFTGIGPSPALIVLLHGFGASSFSWWEVVEPLRSLGTVVSYDRTGFGFTERPTKWEGVNPYGSIAQCDVLSTLTERYRVGDQPVVLVGHSAGGTLALDCAAAGEVPATHLVLIAPAALSGGGPPGIRLVRFLPPLDRLGPLLVQGISESGNEVLFDSVWDSSVLTDEVLAGYRAPLQVEGWERGLWEFTLAPRREVDPEVLKTIDLPALVITGDSDAIVSPADSEAIARALPDARITVLPQTGHLPQEERPDQTLRAIEAFLTTPGG
jgi:pimeloyl-ACP methyl ester carboxylesterase